MDEKIKTGEICPYCGEPSQYIDSAGIYSNGRSYGMVYACLPCQAWVGVHQGTNKALGRLANSELRQAKSMAHLYFDPLWKRKMKVAKLSKRQARGAAYKWLAGQMEIPTEDCHIGMFDVPQCKEVVKHCLPFLKNQHPFQHETKSGKSTKSSK